MLSEAPSLQGGQEHEDQWNEAEAQGECDV